MKINKISLILFVFVGVLAIATSIAYIVLAVLGVLTNYIGVDIFFAIFTPCIYILFALSGMLYLYVRNTTKTLVEENKYYFGRPSKFYNYQFFTKRVGLLNRIVNKEKEAYIIAFSPMNISVMNNAKRNDVISDYIYRFSLALKQKVRRTSKKKSSKNISFCYYRGVFLICLFGEIIEANNIIKKLEESMYNIASENKLNVYVQPFFGIAPFSRVKKQLFEDVEKANIARNEAERLFKTTEIFSEEMIKKTNINEIEKLQEALKNEEFIVYYQPKFNLTKSEFTSSEALIRWKSKDKGLISPAKFIELAENGGLIHQVDMYVFRKVCEDLRDAKRRGRRLLPVSVNFSMQEFYDTNFVDSLVSICEELQVPTNLLYIEITERTTQVNTFMTASIVNKLRQKGFLVLMDDFGTGYSALNNLMSINFDAIKLDRSYIVMIENDQKIYELTRLLINFCKSNNILFVAEGVDRQEQVDILKKLKCDIIQGFYYSKPLDRDEYYKFLLPNGNSFEKVRKEK